MKKILEFINHKTAKITGDNYFQYKPYINLSFSQEGEDLVLHRLLSGKKSGFYVDVGAHHPYRFSNTFKFYLEGWRGINIDPLPGTMNLFQKHRERDINLEIGIADSPGNLTYYMFQDPAFNTFNESRLETVKNHSALLETKLIKTDRLENILNKHLPANRDIDFMSIDVEGFDLVVLASNNWQLYRPLFIVLESLDTSLHKVYSLPFHSFMQEKGYSLVAKCVNSIIYQKEY